MFCNSLVLGLTIKERAYGPDASQGNFAIVTLNASFCYGTEIVVMEIVINKGKTRKTL